MIIGIAVDVRKLYRRLPVRKQLLPTIATNKKNTQKSRWNISDDDVRRFASSLQSDHRNASSCNNKEEDNSTRYLEGEKFVSLSKQDNNDDLELESDIVNAGSGCDIYERDLLRRYSL